MAIVESLSSKEFIHYDKKQAELEKHFRENRPKFNFKIGDGVELKEEKEYSGVYIVEKIHFVNNKFYIDCYLETYPHVVDSLYGDDPLCWSEFKHSRKQKIQNILKDL